MISVVLNSTVVLFTIGVIIFVHELGHFLLARWNGVEVIEFAIGFGPKLCSVRRGGTRYSIRLIPFGGYVRMSGDDRRLLEMKDEGGAPSDKEYELDEETRATLSRPEGWFLSKGYFAKSSIVVAGPLFNIFFALALAMVSFSLFGEPVLERGPVIGDVQIGKPADNAGLRPGDRVASVDGVLMESWKQLAATIRGSGGKELQFVVERDIKDASAEGVSSITIQVQPVPDSGELEAVIGAPATGHVIGIAPAFSFTPMSFDNVVVASANQVWRLSVLTAKSFGWLIAGKISHKHVGGPIQMFQEASRSAKRGSGSLLTFMIFINVTLAVLNLLPIPILDGGHLLFFTVEAIKGSAISMVVYQRLTAAGMIVLLGLMALALTNDLGRVLGFH